MFCNFRFAVLGVQAIAKNCPVRDRDLLFLTIQYWVQAKMPHRHEKFHLEPSPWSYFSIKNRNLPFNSFHYPEIWLTRSIIGINLVLCWTKITGGFGFSTSKGILHPASVAAQAKPVQQSSAGRFPPRIGLFTKPCSQNVARCSVLLLLLVSYTACSSSFNWPPV